MFSRHSASQRDLPVDGRCAGAPGLRPFSNALVPCKHATGQAAEQAPHQDSGAQASEAVGDRAAHRETPHRRGQHPTLGALGKSVGVLPLGGAAPASLDNGLSLLLNLEARDLALTTTAVAGAAGEERRTAA